MVCNHNPTSLFLAAQVRASAMLLVTPAESYKEVPWDWIHVQSVYTKFRENRLNISKLQISFHFHKLEGATKSE
jgi:hypothetical protein